MEELMDLDLNQEPSWEPLLQHDDSVLGLGSLLNDIGVNGRIEERIQQLEAVTSRAMQRRTRRQGQTSFQSANEDDVGGLLAVANINSEGSVALEDRRTDWDSRSCKRCNTHLIAKALEMEMEIDVKKVESGGGGFYDCNICLDIPRDPIVTCCGHMFCWPCFYRLPYDQSGVRECPVCKGEVADKNIIPVYGGSDASYRSEAEESGLKVPPRPQARRVETVRQQLRIGRVGPQLITRGFSTFQIEEALRRVVTNRGEVPGEQTPLRELDGSQITSERTNFVDAQVSTSQIPREAERSRRIRILRRTRLLAQEADSLSSLSSTLSSALHSVESMVDDLETIINRHPIRRNLAEAPPINNRDSFTNADNLINSEDHTLDTTVGMNSTGPFLSGSSRTGEERIREQLDRLVGPSSMRRNRRQSPVVDSRNSVMMVLEGQNLNAAAQTNSTLPLSSSPLMSTDLPSNLHLENETTATAFGNSSTRPTSGVSTRRRSDVLNILDVDSGVSREPRRRRLR